jgi:hypothetical protein
MAKLSRAPVFSDLCTAMKRPGIIRPPYGCAFERLRRRECATAIIGFTFCCDAKDGR